MSSSPKSEIIADAPVFLSIQEVLFAVEAAALRKMQSPFLDALTSADSPFQKPSNGVYVVEASAESFSMFLHFFRFGVLPSAASGRSEQDVLQDAGFFGIRDAISAALMQQRESLTQSLRAALQRSRRNLQICLEEAQEEKRRRVDDEPHHNRRSQWVASGVPAAALGISTTGSAWAQGTHLAGFATRR